MQKSYLPKEDSLWFRLIANIDRSLSEKVPHSIIHLCQNYYYCPSDEFAIGNDDKMCLFTFSRRKAIFLKHNVLHSIYGQTQIRHGAVMWKLRICPKREYVGNLVKIGIKNMITNEIYCKVLNGYKEIDMQLNVTNNTLYYNVTNIHPLAKNSQQPTTDIIKLNEAANNYNNNPIYQLIVTFYNRTEVQIITTEKKQEIYRNESIYQKWYNKDKNDEYQNKIKKNKNKNNNKDDENQIDKDNQCPNQHNNADKKIDALKDIQVKNETLIRCWECPICKSLNNWFETFIRCWECKICYNYYNIKLGLISLKESDYNCIISAQRKEKEKQKQNNKRMRKNYKLQSLQCSQKSMINIEKPNHIKWSCSTCTFLNHLSLNKCQMCGNEC